MVFLLVFMLFTSTGIGELYRFVTFPCNNHLSLKQGILRNIKCSKVDKLENYVKKVSKSSLNLTEKLEKIYEYQKKLYSKPEISTYMTPCFGKENAKYTFFVFMDFQCGFCRSFRFKIYDLVRKYPIRMCIKYFPVSIAESYPFLTLVAVASYLQGRFFEVFELIYRFEFSNESQLFKALEKSGIDLKKLKKDLDSEGVKNIIIRDSYEGGMYGVTKTPSILYKGEVFTNFLFLEDWINSKISKEE